MNKINRLFPNICSDQLEASKQFYTQLFDFTIEFDSDWFINLISSDRRFELGIIKRDHEIVPKQAQGNSGGFYLTFVVDDVNDIFQIATAAQFKIVSPPEDTPYGQRRLLLEDPNGVIVDISSRI